MQSVCYTCLMTILLLLVLNFSKVQNVGKILNLDYNQPNNHISQTIANKHGQRLFVHHSYDIIDTSYFILYYRLKAVEKIPNKGVMMVDQYYFSKTINDDIYELSIHNLKKAFPANRRFHYALDQQFRSDRDLMDYDVYQKEYKLKYIFSQSVND